MEFDRDKCAKYIFLQGRPTKTDNIKMDLETTMQEQDNKASYKYLGVEEGHQIYHEKMSKRITKEHLHRTRLILKTYFYQRTKIKAIKLAVSVSNTAVK